MAIGSHAILYVQFGVRLEVVGNSVIRGNGGGIALVLTPIRLPSSRCLGMTEVAF